MSLGLSADCDGVSLVSVLICCLLGSGTLGGAGLFGSGSGSDTGSGMITAGSGGVSVTGDSGGDGARGGVGV